ncbi:hypothetical protein [Legionella lansingensis]|nr:hypothetical protein [Legionella lansingensis]
MKKVPSMLSPYHSIEDMRDIWKKAMHLAYVYTHPNEPHPYNCSYCITLENREETIRRLELTRRQSISTDLKSLTLFILGVYITAAREVSGFEFQLGITFIVDSMQTGNAHAAYYLAAMYAGCHRNKSSFALIDVEKAIEYYHLAFKLGSYEALDDLMHALRIGQGKISQDITQWHQLFVSFFQEAITKDDKAIASLIRCLVQQNYSACHSEAFLFRAGDILNDWMTSPHWLEKHTEILKKYIQQQIDAKNIDALYLQYVLFTLPEANKLLLSNKEVRFFGKAFIPENKEKKWESESLEWLLFNKILHNEIESIRSLILMNNEGSLQSTDFVTIALGKLRKLSWITSENFPDINMVYYDKKLVFITAIIHKKHQGKLEEKLSDMFTDLEKNMNHFLALVSTRNSSHPSLGHIVISYINYLKLLMHAIEEKVNLQTETHLKI